MRQMMVLIVANLTRQETEWSYLYKRLVQAKCPYDEHTGERKGKLRIMGRVAGQMIETMYALLKKDVEILSKITPGQEPPPPILYDPALHRRHREGHYQPLKSSSPPSIIMLQPK